MWPDKVLRQFQTVPTNPSESDFHGPYNKLFYTLFPSDSDYTVVPQYLKLGSTQSSDWIMTFEVFLVDKPILILELKNPGDLHFVSARALADSQIRQRMGDLCADCPIPTLYAISAMGTALCFYSLETKRQDAEIMRLNVPRHPTRINDTAPKGRWDLDILTVGGENKFRAVVEEIKQACESLGDSSLI